MNVIMNGQSIAVIIIVALAVAYLLWRLAHSRRPGAQARGGCACCAAACAARQNPGKPLPSPCPPNMKPQP